MHTTDFAIRFERNRAYRLSSVADIQQVEAIVVMKIQ